MANRIPLIVDSSSNQVKELPAGDSLILSDSEKVILGTGSDLQVYHDSSNSYIKDTNASSDLLIQSNNIVLEKTDGENMIHCAGDGAVQIYHNGSTKIATSAAGATVTGTLNVAGNVTYSGSSLTVEDTLTDGSTVTWNAINSPVAKVTLAGNRTITVSNNLGTGQYISLLAIQDGTGSRTLTWNAMFEFKGDEAPTLTTTASKGDLFTFRYNGAKWLEVGRNQNLSLS